MNFSYVLNTSRYVCNERFYHLELSFHCWRHGGIAFDHCSIFMLGKRRIRQLCQSKLSMHSVFCGRNMYLATSDDWKQVMQQIKIQVQKFFTEDKNVLLPDFQYSKGHLLLFFHRFSLS